MKTVVLVIAPDQFRDEEYAEPKEVLERRGATVITASVAPGPCRGRFGLLARADEALREVSPATTDAIAFIGGAGSKVFFDDPDAHSLALAVHESGKPVAAICIAPSTLAHAGLLGGKRVTSFPSQEDDLVAHGAAYTGAPVEIDGLIITAAGPEAATAFGEAIGDTLGLPA
ncbi:MAG: DJ-1/PfpI family protein [Actinomycetota bacterium]|nr:DJ-1/PfpI family protein [Actinomycetota bacterium]